MFLVAILERLPAKLMPYTMFPAGSRNGTADIDKISLVVKMGCKTVTHLITAFCQLTSPFFFFKP
jgi:hypothetical protein